LQVFWLTQEGKLPERWLYEKSKLVSSGVFVAGRPPERLLFPRNRKLSEGRLKID